MTKEERDRASELFRKLTIEKLERLREKRNRDMNEYVDIGKEMGHPPTSDHKITELYAIISRGPDGEGLFAMGRSYGMIQAVTTERETLELIKPHLPNLPIPPELTLHMCKFALVEEIERLK